MAKATRAGGDSYTPDEFEDPDPPVRIQRAMIGEVDKPSVGGSSETSSEKESTRKESTTRSDPLRVRTTESPSKPLLMEPDSDAPLTDGSGPKTTPQQSARKTTPAKKQAPKARFRSTSDEFDDF